MNRRSLLAFALALLAPLAACVSQSTYESARKELDASARALGEVSEHARACDTEREELRTERDAARARGDELQAAVDELNRQLAATREEADAEDKPQALDRLPPASETEPYPPGLALKPIAVKDLNPLRLRARFEAGGWALVNPPTEASEDRYRGVVFPVVRGAMGGAVAIYEYDDLAAAARFEESMRAKGAATARHDRKVVSVLIQRYDGVATKVLKFILGS